MSYEDCLSTMPDLRCSSENVLSLNDERIIGDNTVSFESVILCVYEPKNKKYRWLDKKILKFKLFKI